MSTDRDEQAASVYSRAVASAVELEHHVEQLRESRRRLSETRLYSARMRARLRETQAARRRSFMEAAPHAFVLTDTIGVIVAANENAAALAGVPKERLHGQFLLGLIDQEHRGSARLQLAELAHSAVRKQIAFELVQADGGRQTVLATAGRMADGDRELVLWALEPIDSIQVGENLRRASIAVAETLRAQERSRLKLLFERLDLSVITVTRDLRIEFANSSALLLLLLLPERPAGGQDLPELWPELSLTKLAAELFKPGASPGEWHVAPQDSDSRYLVRGIPALGLDTVVIVIRDVTESERLIEAEREFISNAAHELRTPLAAIVSAIDVLELGAKEVPVERDRFLEHIGREADRLVRLTASLLALARAQTLGERVRTELLELKPLLEEVIESVCTEADLRVALTCPEGLVAIANRELTLQALENLCANALRYTSEGRIDIKAREVEGNAVLIDIIDTGPGIPSELRGRVLHRFVRGGDGSTGFGLGLAIASQAVDAIGGTLELDSEPGRGTTARVTLPAARLLTA